jgi:hypothetical protein
VSAPASSSSAWCSSWGADLEELAPNRNSLIASRSFGRPIETKHELEEAVSAFAARAAEKKRRQNLATANVAVWIETNSFKPTGRQYSASKSVSLPIATVETGKLIAAPIKGLAIIFEPGYRYKKAGVTFIELVQADRVQSGLFNRRDDARSMGVCRQSMLSTAVTAAAPLLLGRPACARRGQRIDADLHPHSPLRPRNDHQDCHFVAWRKSRASAIATICENGPLNTNACRADTLTWTSGNICCRRAPLAMRGASSATSHVRAAVLARRNYMIEAPRGARGSTG